MFRGFVFSMLLAAVVVTGSLAQSNAGKQLTPTNVGVQALTFVIHAEKIKTLTRFSVSVQERQKMMSPDVAGYLLIIEGNKQLASCPVAPAKDPKKVMYEFLVSNKHLEKSRFLLEESGLMKKGMLNGERYWFYLKDFARKATASAVIGQQTNPPLNDLDKSLLTVP